MIHELRREHNLTILLEIAQLPKATFYYHCKNQGKQDKYANAKAEITAIFHENKGRYGYRRVTDVTEFRLFGQKLYLSPTLDLCSGDIVTYTISERPNLLMVTTMLEQAFQKIPDNTGLLLFLWSAKKRTSLPTRI